MVRRLPGAGGRGPEGRAGDHRLRHGVGRSQRGVSAPRPGRSVQPHLVADGRYQDPDDAFSSYYEYGGGLSLVFLVSPEREYRVERGAYELLLQYKRGEFLDVGLEATEDTFDGWLATGILRF